MGSDNIFELSNEVLNLMESNSYVKALSLLKSKRIFLNHFEPKNDAERKEYLNICSTEMTMAIIESHMDDVVQIFEWRREKWQAMVNKNPDAFEADYMKLMLNYAMALLKTDKKSAKLYLEEYARFDPENERVQEVLIAFENQNTKPVSYIQRILYVLMADMILSLVINVLEIENEFKWWIHLISFIIICYLAISGYFSKRHT